MDALQRLRSAIAHLDDAWDPEISLDNEVRDQMIATALAEAVIAVALILSPPPAGGDGR